MKNVVIANPKLILLILAIIICLSVSPFFVKDDSQEFATSYGFPNSFVIIYDVNMSDYFSTAWISRVSLCITSFAFNIFVVWLLLAFMLFMIDFLRSFIFIKQSSCNQNMQTTVKNMSEYKKVLICFCILIICISLFYRPNNGEIVMFMLFNLLGIRPDIVVGVVTFHIFPLIPIAGGLFCLKKIFKYWHLTFNEFDR